MRTIFLMASFMLLTGRCDLVAGQVIAHSPFTGAFREGFEDDFPTFYHPQFLCFSGHATAIAVPGGFGLSVIVAWGGPGGQMEQHSGVWFMVPHTGTAVDWVFEEPARRFGGYFATIYLQPGATAQFYNEAGALMATMPIACPTGGQWKWDGWEATGEGFKRVRITGVQNPGNVAHDDLQLDFMDSCYGDCDESGALTVGDFSCFQAWFVAADPRADCNSNGKLTVADFSCFQNAFVQGCP